MSDSRQFIRTIQIAPRDDVVILIFCFLLTVFFDMTVAVAVGMGLAAMLFIRRSIKLSSTTRANKNHTFYGDLPDSIALYDINGSLFFGSAQKALQAITRVTPELKVVILNMREVNMMDMSAIIAMESIKTSLAQQNIKIIISNLQQRMIDKLCRIGICDQTDQLQFSNTVREAIVIAKQLTQLDNDAN